MTPRTEAREQDTTKEQGTNEQILVQIVTPRELTWGNFLLHSESGRLSSSTADVGSSAIAQRFDFSLLHRDSSIDLTFLPSFPFHARCLQQKCTFTALLEMRLEKMVENDTAETINGSRKTVTHVTEYFGYKYIWNQIVIGWTGVAQRKELKWCPFVPAEELIPIFLLVTR